MKPSKDHVGRVVVLALTLITAACSASPAGTSTASPSSQSSSGQASSSPGTAATLGASGPKFQFLVLGQDTTSLRAYTLVEQPYFSPGGIAQKASNGRLTFSLTTAVELGIRGVDRARTLRSGVVDIARVGMLALGSDLPLASGGDIAGLYPDFATARKATDAFLPRLSKLLEDQQGMKLLGSHPFSGDVLWCKQPIQSLDDLKGKRIRTNGTSVADLVAALGATNVTVNFAEVYSALQQGVVDCAITDYSSGNTERWWEIVSNMYDFPVSYGASAYAINLKTWNSLPQDVQAYLQQIFSEVTDKQWALAPQLATAGVACNKGDTANCPKDLGVAATRPMTVTKPAPADLEKIKKLAQDSVIPAWLNRCGGAILTTVDCRSIFNQTIGQAVGITLK